MKECWAGCLPDNVVFVIFKPEAVKRGLIGACITRFENKGFTPEVLCVRQLDAYKIRKMLHVENVNAGTDPIVDDAVASFLGGPAIVGLFSCRFTMAKELADSVVGLPLIPGTILGDYAQSLHNMLVYVSAAKADGAVTREDAQLFLYELMPYYVPVG